MAGRQILDGALVANEMVKDLRRKKVISVVFKLDFEKAYDRVYWAFVDWGLARKALMRAGGSGLEVCLSLVTFSVILNGKRRSWFGRSCHYIYHL